MNIRKFVQIAILSAGLIGWCLPCMSIQAAWLFPNIPAEIAQAKKDKPKKPKKPPTAPELPTGLLYGVGAGALGLAYFLASKRRKNRK